MPGVGYSHGGRQHCAGLVDGTLLTEVFQPHLAVRHSMCVPNFTLPIYAYHTPALLQQHLSLQFSRLARYYSLPDLTLWCHQGDKQLQGFQIPREEGQGHQADLLEISWPLRCVGAAAQVHLRPIDILVFYMSVFSTYISVHTR